jgi:hypothetical protein
MVTSIVQAEKMRRIAGQLLVKLTLSLARMEIAFYNTSGAMAPKIAVMVPMKRTANSVILVS